MRGHIRARGSNTWAIVLDHHDPETGKRRRKWHSFKGTKREAQLQCAKLIAEAQGSAVVDPSRMTVREYLDRFEADWVAIHTTARSAERYAVSLAPVRRQLGARRLEALRPLDFTGFYAELVRAGKAPRTIRHIHGVMHRALSQAKTWSLVRDNCLEQVRPPRVPDREVVILQPDRARQLIERLRGTSIYLLAMLALATGARRNELLAIRWKDLDLDAGRMRVEQALEQTAAYGIRTKAPKTRSGRRSIALPASAVAELRAHWIAQQEQRLAIGLGKAPPDGFVFSAIDGRPLSPDGVTHTWMRAAAAAGMPVSFHSLRHCHVSALIASGMDVLTIARRLGHASPVITLKTYGHMIAGTDERAAQIAEEAFGCKMVANEAKKPPNPR
jgi:integrase